ncbi:MAG: hypothetical protein WC444_00805 [Candidatus Paceibacterota bacterium]
MSIFLGKWKTLATEEVANRVAKDHTVTVRLSGGWANRFADYQQKASARPTDIMKDGLSILFALADAQQGDEKVEVIVRIRSSNGEITELPLDQVIPLQTLADFKKNAS